MVRWSGLITLQQGQRQQHPLIALRHTGAELSPFLIWSQQGALLPSRLSRWHQNVSTSITYYKTGNWKVNKHCNCLNITDNKTKGVLWSNNEWDYTTKLSIEVIHFGLDYIAAYVYHNWMKNAVFLASVESNKVQPKFKPSRTNRGWRWRHCRMRRRIAATNASRRGTSSRSSPPPVAGTSAALSCLSGAASSGWLSPSRRTRATPSRAPPHPGWWRFLPWSKRPLFPAGLTLLVLPTANGISTLTL